MKRWALYIDIEGFSNIYNKDHIQALQSLGGLMADIYKIANDVYPESGKRLFAHQLGDGFIIISDFEEENLERPLSIAVTLLQSTLLKGGTARAAISEGEFADIRGCYPDIIQKNINQDGILRPGQGIMTIFNVMGSALINANKIAQKSPKGPCLLVDLTLKHKVPFDSFPPINETSDILEINWFLTKGAELKKNRECLGIDNFAESVFVENMNKYLSKYTNLSEDWKASANRLIEESISSKE